MLIYKENTGKFYLCFVLVIFLWLINIHVAISCSRINGIVKSWQREPIFKELFLLEGVIVRDGENKFIIKTDKIGGFDFLLPKENFKLIFEKKGYKPILYTIKNDDFMHIMDCSIGKILMEELPVFVDPNYVAMENVEITIKRLNKDGTTALCEKTKTDKFGKIFLKYHSDFLTIEAVKKGYKKFSVDVDLVSSEYKFPKEFILIPQ